MFSACADMHSMQIFARACVRVCLCLCMRHCFLFIHGDRRKFPSLCYLCHCFISSCKCTQTCPHIYDYARQWNSIELNCSIQRKNRRIAHRNKANAITFSYLYFSPFHVRSFVRCRGVYFFGRDFVNLKFRFHYGKSGICHCIISVLLMLSRGCCHKM